MKLKRRNHVNDSIGTQELMHIKLYLKKYIIKKIHLFTPVCIYAQVQVL